MEILISIMTHAFDLLLESSAYILFGILMAGLIKVFLMPGYVSKHLGGGKTSSVIKAALLGVPMPLCSCSVLPTAAALKRQGASNGATTAFLISTPESGVDSIAVSYALLDPIMTIVRPVAGAVSAIVAGVAENLGTSQKRDRVSEPDLSCQVDDCCDGVDCPPEEHAHHHSFGERLKAGVKFALFDVWYDLAGWFLIGLLLAGIVTALIPEDFMAAHLGGGLSAMLIMLGVGIPIYICATASTPIAAALILQGVSPGAALVFLLAGPATNITSLTVVLRILGKRATVIYLVVIALFAVLFGLAVDEIYSFFAISPKTTVGQAGEMIPMPIKLIGAVGLLILSIQPVYRKIRSWLPGQKSHHHDQGHGHDHENDQNPKETKPKEESCGCCHHH